VHVKIARASSAPCSIEMPSHVTVICHSRNFKRGKLCHVIFDIE
jgi:hypothetical protein